MRMGVVQGAGAEIVPKMGGTTTLPATSSHQQQLTAHSKKIQNLQKVIEQAERDPQPLMLSYMNNVGGAGKNRGATNPERNSLKFNKNKS